jgi:AraC-like DNA-binding protein
LLIGQSDGEALHTAEQDAHAKMPLASRVAEIMKERSLDNKAALKQVARERGITRREAYKQLLITRDE